MESYTVPLIDVMIVGDSRFQYHPVNHVIHGLVENLNDTSEEDLEKFELQLVIGLDRDNRDSTCVTMARNFELQLCRQRRRHTKI